MSLAVDGRTQGFGSRLRWQSSGTGYQQLTFSAWQLRWAAMTVGKPPQFPMRGRRTAYDRLEFAFRKRLIDACLTTDRPGLLQPTNAYRRLDRTEKGAASYFIGMAFAKLFAFRALEAAYVVHLDQYDASYPGALAMAGSRRPDLVAQDATGGWCTIEAKGRQGIGTAELDKVVAGAKAQAQSVATISGTPLQAAIASVTRMGGTGLTVDFVDPRPDQGGLDIQIDDARFLQTYYHPFTEFLREHSEHATVLSNIGVQAHSIGDSGFVVGVEERVYDQLESGRLDRGLADDWPVVSTQHDEDGYLGADGVYVGRAQ